MTTGQDFDLQALRQLLGRFETAVLVTHGPGSSLHGRPMAVAQIEDNGDLWFLTASDTPKTQEIQTNNQVLVTFQDKDTRFVSLSGRAEVVRDNQKIDELWKEFFKIWFPEGKTDPTLMLIHISTEQGEYWDNAGVNRIAFVMDALRDQAGSRQSGNVEIER